MQKKQKNKQTTFYYHLEKMFKNLSCSHGGSSCGVKRQGN